MLERIKPLAGLVTTLLDQIPDDVWASDSTTFFDPAIGGGQFVKEVESKLRSYGHSDQNIRSRVFGFEHTTALIDLAVNMNSLVGQYVKKSYAEYFELDSSMQFDVVLGNPPYHGNNDKGTVQPKSHNLWSKFVDKALDVAKKDGYIALVTPDSWMSPNSQVLKRFKEYSMLWVDTDVSQHFAVGSSFTAWVIQKNKNTPTVTIDGLAVEIANLAYLPRNFAKSYPIHNKVINSSSTKLPILSDSTCHSDHKHGKLSDTKDSTFKHKTYHTNAQIKYSKLKSKDFDKNKIVWTLSGYFKPFYDNGKIGTTEICQYILVKDDKEANNILSYFDSKLYKFLINTGKWSGFLNGKLLNSLPRLDNKKWTDKELYKLFNLTKEEIDYIEQS